MALDLHADLAMKTLLDQYPGARRALFSSFHIGGRQSCAYKDEETLAEVCQRNEIPVEEALKCLQESHEHDHEMLISPAELETLLSSEAKFVLLDIRTREEHEAITLPGAKFMTQEDQSALFSQSEASTKVILFDHQGRSVLDQCAWFRGHGLKETFGLDGGIDRYAKEIDSSIPRYRLEMD